MIKRIQQLPAVIANQIAAGEVIERPASVVKELLENSLDAGATHIDIDIAYGGLNGIKISDNGHGILAEDLPLAVAAHATSKIACLDDLYAINSMGFRGEALASIASIAKLKISSKPDQQAHAMMLSVREEKQELFPCARARGTTIDVQDLFFNAPVRKRFLKSEKLEFQAIEMVVKRFALSVPHLGLSLNHNDKLIFSLGAAVDEITKEQRMTKIMGRAFIDNAVFLDVEQGSMRLHGWLSNQNYQRSQNDRQWIYINQRMVKDKLIHHALKQAYEGLLHPGRFPSCLLYFTMNPQAIDINVHPTKHEVRFEQPRLVHDFFISQITRALTVEQAKEQTPVQIQEPIAQWSYTEHAQNTLPPVSREHSWTNLNKQFSLVWLNQQVYLVDAHFLYQAWLKEQAEGGGYPLASRPLLVAVRYPLRDLIPAPELLKSSLLRLGIAIEIQENDIFIRTTPIALPYLDLKLFFNSLSTGSDFSLEHMQALLIKAHAFDATQLNSEERLCLEQFFLEQMQKNKQGIWYKELSLNNCRTLLNV